MEKSTGEERASLCLNGDTRQRTHRFRWVLRAATILLLLCYAFWHLNTPAWKGNNAPASSTSDFDWDKLPTKPHLEYQSCYEDFDCARLELPMDHWNGTTNATISLAVIRKAAKVPITDPRYGGAVLANPGGPGGSGVYMLRARGGRMQDIVDAHKEVDELTAESSQDKYFDMLSFDPRGVGLSEPAVHCFEDAALYESWRLRTQNEGILGSSDAAFGRLWSMSTAYGKSCSLPTDGPDIKEYVTTASVAHDMLSLVEAHGLWRKTEAMRVLQPEAGCGAHQTTVHVPEHLLNKPGQEKIQYWGFSYGTYLGATFAAMFPNRVERLIIDGVVNAENYAKGLWSDNLQDTDKDMETFYYHCARVGYPTCALASKDSSPADIKAKVANITQSLYHNPLPVIGSNAEVIEYSDVRNLIFASLYTPIESFPYLANLLAEVEKGDGAQFSKLLRAYHELSCSCPSENTVAIDDITPLRNKTSGKQVSLDGSAGMVIRCSDGDSQSAVSKTAFLDYTDELKELSHTLGEIWAALRMDCIAYAVRPRYRFIGPWVGETSHPLLLIGNTADPVTPLVSAHKMAKGFKDSVVLTQNSPGHCSLSTYSACTVKYAKAYFQTGELPEEGTVCEPDELPFGPTPGEGVESVSVEITEAIGAHRELAAALHGAGGGFMRSGLGGRFRDVWFD